MHHDPHSPSFQELLGSMEASAEHWDETLPQEKFLKDKGEKKYWYQSKSELNKYTEQYKKSTEVTSQRSYQHKEKSGKAVEISGEEANKHPLYVELKKIAGEASTVSSFCLAIHVKAFFVLYFELRIRNPLFELEVLLPWQNFTTPGTLSTNLDKLQDKLAMVVAKLKTPQDALLWGAIWQKPSLQN